VKSKAHAAPRCYPSIWPGNLVHLTDVPLERELEHSEHGSGALQCVTVRSRCPHDALGDFDLSAKTLDEVSDQLLEEPAR
jgi:hypothetical protein